MIKIKLYGIKPEFKKRTNIILFMVPTIVEENINNTDDYIILSLKFIKNKFNVFHSFVPKKIKEIIEEKMYFEVTNNIEYLKNINFYSMIKNIDIHKYLSSKDIVNLCELVIKEREIGYVEREQIKYINNIYKNRNKNPFIFKIDNYNRVKVPLKEKLSIDISSFNEKTHYIKIFNRGTVTYNYKITELDGYKKIFNNDYQNFVKNISPEKLLEKAFNEFKRIKKENKYNLDLSNFLIISLYEDLKEKIELTIKQENII